MKKLFVFTILCLMITGQLFSQTRILVNSGDNQLNLTSKSLTGFSVNNTIGYFDIQLEQMFNKGYVEIATNGYGPSYNIGNPDLPVINRLIEVPVGATVEVRIIGYEELIYKLSDYDVNMPLTPSQESVSKSADLTKLEFKKNEKVYQTNDWFSNPIARYHDEGTMRGVRLGRLEISPFAYNPVTGELKVINDLTIEVRFIKGDYTKTEQLKKQYYSPAFNGIFTGLLNYTNPARQDLSLNSIPMVFVIISHRMFESTLAPFVEWKKKQGFVVHVKYTDEPEVGATTTSIKSYLKGLYDNATPANPAPAFVALVGDVQQIPAFNGTAGSHPTDLYYSTYSAAPNDKIPDVHIGRMSAQTTAQLESIISKTLLYERFQMESPAYLTNTLTIAGYDVNNAPLYGNGALNYMALFLNAAHGINPTAMYHPCSGQTQQVLNALNAGVSIGVYTAHCDWNLWDNPRVDVSHINNLTNNEKYGLLIGNCCLSAKFNENECFGEAVIRAVNKGGIGYIGGSNNTYWSEDYWWATGYGTVVLNPQLQNFGVGSFSALFHENGEPAGMKALTGSQMNLAGRLAVQQSNSSMKTYYWEIYNYLGDPTLMPYLGPMPDMNPSYPSAMPLGLTSIEITNLAPDSYVALTDNGVLKAAGFADNTGSIELEFETFAQPVTADLVATTTFYKPFMGTVEIVPDEGPYVVYSSYEVTDAEVLTYISTNSEIEVTLKNVGAEPTGELNVSISCSDPQITIVDNTASCESIDPYETGTVKFKVTVENDIPDNKTFLVDVNITNEGKASWESKMPLKAYAPKFKLEKVLVNGVEGGSLPKGGLATLTTIVKNQGGADAYATIGNLEFTNAFITPACDDAKRGGKNIPAGESIEFVYYIIIDDAIPYGYVANFNLNLEAQYGRTFTAPFTATCAGANSYCTPSSTGCSSDKFTSVELVKKSNSTSLFINTNNTCASGGYQNYLGTSATILPGEQYTIKVRVSYSNDNVKGWIDYNGNNSFDENEVFINISCPSTSLVYSQDFTVPENATPGTVRMRLRVKDGGEPGTCDGYTYGQTHDYTIIIPDLYPRVQNVEAELQGGTIAVSWEAPTAQTPIGYNIYRNGNLLNTTILTETEFVETLSAIGVYAYSVTAVYEDDKESSGSMSNVICSFFTCETPVNLEGTAEGKTAVLTWEDSEDVGEDLLGYNVYRDGEKINETLISELKYDDEDLAVGTYKYQVSAKYDNLCEESELTEEITVIIAPEFCETPVNLEVTPDDAGINITWNAPENIDGELLGYNVYRDDVIINEELIIETEYFDEDIVFEPGTTYIYQVSAVYVHCDESELTEGVEIIIENINNLQTPLFSIHPNPTTGNVIIEGNGLYRVEIYDVQGRKLLEYNNVNEVLQINVNNYENGMYFVRMYSDSNTITKRLVIMK